MNSSRHTGRSPAVPRRRRPQVDRLARTASRSTRRLAVRRRPAVRRSSPTSAMVALSRAPMPPTPSAGVIETVALTLAPGRASAAMPREIRSSRPRTPRNSDPHGNRMRISSARPINSAGGDSAAATTNTRLALPPRPVARAARRDVSAIDAASASTPMTRAVGSAWASARAARPSPVPRSMITRSWRATSLATYPTSTSTRRRPMTVRMRRSYPGTTCSSRDASLSTSGPCAPHTTMSSIRAPY